MKINKRKMVFNRGTEKEEERTMIVIEKEGYDLHKVTESDIGKTFRLYKDPVFLTKEQYEEIRSARL